MEFVDSHEYGMLPHAPFSFQQLGPLSPLLSSPSSPFPFDDRHSCLASPRDTESQQSISTDSGVDHVAFSRPTFSNLPLAHYHFQADTELSNAHSPLQLHDAASPDSLSSATTSFGDSFTDLAFPSTAWGGQLHPDMHLPEPMCGSTGTRRMPFKRRTVCRSACVPCRQSKTGCDGQRPCMRCVAGDRTERCVARPAEEVERCRLNRGRKMTKRARASTPSDPPDPPPSSGDFPDPPVPKSLSSDVPSSAAVLAMGQATIMLTDLIDRAEELCRTLQPDEARTHPFIRSAHVLLAHMTDSMSVEQFEWLVRRSGWLETPRRSSPLGEWSSSETWPLPLDWRPSPLVCSSRPVVADVDVLESAAVRVYCLPGATAALELWERGAVSGSKVHQMLETQEAKVMESKALNSLFSCLLLSGDGGPNADGEVKATEDTERSNASSSRHHASWCNVSAVDRSPPPTASIRPLSSAATVLCTCERSVPLPCCLQVNAAWERLFGWSQAEVRRQLILRGTGAMADWYTNDSWHTVHALLASHVFASAGKSEEMKAFCVMRHKDGHEMPCRMHKTIHSDDRGLDSSFQSFTVL